MIKVIIFDADGVLLNSTRLSMKQHQKICREIGLPVPKSKLIRQHWGKSWEEFLPVLAKELNWPNGSIKIFKDAYIKKHPFSKYPTFKGLRKVLTWLKKQNFLLGIVSSRDRESLLNGLLLAKIDENLFFFIQSLNDYLAIKPNPDVFIPVLQKISEMGFSIEEIIYVGDTINYDYRAAKNHQPTIKFVGITSGATTKKEFIAAGLDKKFILKSATQLPKILNIL